MRFTRASSSLRTWIRKRKWRSILRLSIILLTAIDVSEALLLLYGLMDTAPPPLHTEEVHHRPEFAATSMDNYSTAPTPIDVDSSMSEG
ncbi:uncharacterized protein PITG_23240, partial [Phytophthora infestans T30-4]